MSPLENLPFAVLGSAFVFATATSQAAVTLATINGAQFTGGYGTSTQTVDGNTLRIEAPLSRYGRTYSLPSPLIISNQSTTYIEVDIQVNAAHASNSPVYLALEDLDLAPNAGNETYFYSLNLAGAGAAGFTTVTIPSISNFSFRQSDKDKIVNFDSGGLALIRIAGSYGDTVTDVTISQIRIMDSVPEPSVALLGVLGLGIASFLRRRA